GPGWEWWARTICAERRVCGGRCATDRARNIPQRETRRLHQRSGSVEQSDVTSRLGEHVDASTAVGIPPSGTTPAARPHEPGLVAHREGTAAAATVVGRALAEPRSTDQISPGLRGLQLEVSSCISDVRARSP